MTPCYNTGKVLIGRAYTPPPQRMLGDAVQVQQALLDRRTASSAAVPGLAQRFAAAVWRWL